MLKGLARRASKVDLLRQVAACILAGDYDRIKEVLGRALDAGLPPNRIIAEGLIAGMDVVGKRFKAGEMFIPEVLASARAMHVGLEMLRPMVAEGERSHCGVLVLGTVKGDIHDIGKNLVAMMMEGAGFEVVDLGVDVPVDRFIGAVKERRPDILGMSALLTTTMGAMSEVIEALKREGLREQVIVLVGGAPVSAEFARQIGADGYAPDAASATELAKELVARRKLGAETGAGVPVTGQ